MRRSRTSVTDLDSLRTTGNSVPRVRRGPATASASVTPVSSPSSGPSATPNSVGSMTFPIGRRHLDDSPRDRLLHQAGYAEAVLATLAGKILQKQETLLEAQETRILSYQGEERARVHLPAHRIQLEASKCLAEIVGIKAPPAKQTVTVVHRLELPDWMTPDVTPPPLDVTPT